MFISSHFWDFLLKREEKVSSPRCEKAFSCLEKGSATSKVPLSFYFLPCTKGRRKKKDSRQKSVAPPLSPKHTQLEQELNQEARVYYTDNSGFKNTLAKSHNYLQCTFPTPASGSPRWPSELTMNPASRFRSSPFQFKYWTHYLPIHVTQLLADYLFLFALAKYSNSPASKAN